MELFKIKDGLFFIKDSTNLPIIETNNGFIIFDSPIDKDKSKKLKKILDEKGIVPKYLIFSHHHADHTGGGKYLKETLNLITITSKEEKVFIENPYLEPIYLSCGSKPTKLILTKWVIGNGVKIDEVWEKEKRIFEGRELEILDLKGHSEGMIGVIVDGVLFSSDLFFSSEILLKYKIPYFFSYDDCIKNLEKIKNLDFEYILPSHGEIYTKEEGLNVINENLVTLNNIKERILKILEVEKNLDQIIEEFNVNVDNLIVSYLIKSSIISLIHYLLDNNLINYTIKRGTVYFRLI